jgi:hypothetical protein
MQSYSFVPNDVLNQTDFMKKLIAALMPGRFEGSFSKAH